MGYGALYRKVSGSENPRNSVCGAVFIRPTRAVIDLRGRDPTFLHGRKISVPLAETLCYTSYLAYPTSTSGPVFARV